MNAAESRKRLLIAESDMHRARLSRDVDTLIGGAHSFVDHCSIFSIVTSVGTALLGKYVSSTQPRKSSSEQSRPWLRSAADALTLVTSLWTATHPPHPSEDRNDPHSGR